MKYLLFTVILLISGCSSEKSNPKVCGFCDGKIYYHESGAFTSEAQYMTQDGKHYHPWCYILKDK